MSDLLNIIFCYLIFMLDLVCEDHLRNLSIKF